MQQLHLGSLRHPSWSHKSRRKNRSQLQSESKHWTDPGCSRVARDPPDVPDGATGLVWLRLWQRRLGPPRNPWRSHSSGLFRPAQSITKCSKQHIKTLSSRPTHASGSYLNNWSFVRFSQDTGHQIESDLSDQQSESRIEKASDPFRNT